MRFSVVLALAAFVSTVSAQLPACAAPCLENGNFGSCQPTDNACLCNSQSFVEAATNCIGSSCKGDDLQAALTAARQLCAVVGVTLTSIPAGFPTSTSPGASGAPATTSSAAAGASTTTNAASIHGVNTMAGVAALLAALAL